MLINKLLMARGRRHFEVRQRQEAAECWRHLKAAIWPEVCRAHTEASKQVWGKNYSRKNAIILLKLRQNLHTIIRFWARRNLRRGRSLKMAEMLMLNNNYYPYQSREDSCDVIAFEFSLSRLRIWLPVQP